MSDEAINSREATVCMVRPTKRTHQHLISVLNDCGVPMIDVASCDDIDFHSVTLNDTELSLGGVPINEITHVFYFGSPRLTSSAHPTHDEIYIQQEWEQALLAGITTSSHLRLLNYAASVTWNRLLLQPMRQLGILSRLGWRIPSVSIKYDCLSDCQSKVRHPEPTDREFVLIGRRRHFWPDHHDHFRLLSEQLASAITKTQIYLRHADLDWCVVPIGIRQDTVFAFGLSFELPNVFLPADLGQLVRDVIYD